MLDIFSDSKVYVLCPHDGTTGGPETLHQLSFRLQEFGAVAYMVYYPLGSAPAVAHHFKKYKPVQASDIEDDERNILIIPEVYVHYLLDTLKKIRKVIWWLSVDYYLKISDRLLTIDDVKALQDE